jgi:hypothetical protein
MSEQPETDSPKVGRPSSYDPAFCQRVVELGEQGKSAAQMAAALRVAKSTIYLWAQEHPEFSDAFTLARTLSQAWWEDKGQAGLETPGFQSSLWAKSVSARFPEDYTERNKTELTGAEGGPIQSQSTVTVAADEAYLRLIG